MRAKLFQLRNVASLVFMVPAEVLDLMAALARELTARLERSLKVSTSIHLLFAHRGSKRAAPCVVMLNFNPRGTAASYHGMHASIVLAYMLVAVLLDVKAARSGELLRVLPFVLAVCEPGTDTAPHGTAFLR